MSESVLTNDFIEEYNINVLKLIEVASSNGYIIKLKEIENIKKLFIKKIDKEDMIIENYTIPLTLNKTSDVIFYEEARQGMEKNKKRKIEKQRIREIKEAIERAKKLAEAQVLKSLSDEDIDLYCLYIK